LHTYKAIGKKATDLTGYPAVSVFHDFKYDPKDFIKGTFDDWMYEHMGVYAWTTEIWSIQKQAGIEDMKYHRVVPRPIRLRMTSKYTSGARRI
jgi:hypothetical protein